MRVAGSIALRGFTDRAGIGKSDDDSAIFHNNLLDGLQGQCRVVVTKFNKKWRVREIRKRRQALLDDAAEFPDAHMRRSLTIENLQSGFVPRFNMTAAINAG